MLRLRSGEAPEPGSTVGGDFDAKRGVWVLPCGLPSYRRKLLHWLGDELGLPHVSAGEGVWERRLHIARERWNLPDKFFIQGEEVVVSAPRRAGGSGQCSRAIVLDPRIHRRHRTLYVRFLGGKEAHIPVDSVRPRDGGARLRHPS